MPVSSMKTIFRSFPNFRTVNVSLTCAVCRQRDSKSLKYWGTLAFFSDARQPEVEVLQSLAVILYTLSGKSSV